jgi:hypothetical protein
MQVDNTLRELLLLVAIERLQAKRTDDHVGTSRIALPGEDNRASEF